MVGRAGMPRPPNSDASTPLYHCPQCRQTLTYHNTRTERNAAGEAVTVLVYLCIHHGFYHVTDEGRLTPGM